MPRKGLMRRVTYEKTYFDIIVRGNAVHHDARGSAGEYRWWSWTRTNYWTTTDNYQNGISNLEIGDLTGENSVWNKEMTPKVGESLKVYFAAADPDDNVYVLDSGDIVFSQGDKKNVNVSNGDWEELKQEYGYSSSMIFEKVDRDVWKLVSVFIPGPIGKPNRTINVSDGVEVSIREILKHNVYKVSGKTYEYNDIYVAIPLHRPDGDMNVLYMYKGSDNFKYDDRVTLIKLLKSHDKNNDALFKFSTIREDDTILINICHDNGSKYYLKCNVDELDEILKTHSKRVFRNNFNTYF